MTYKTRLFSITIRVPKADSAFLYFQLEANEGLAFYSTLPFTKGDGHRDIEINMTEDFIDEINQLLNKLKESISMTVLLEEFRFCRKKCEKAKASLFT